MIEDRCFENNQQLLKIANDFLIKGVEFTLSYNESDGLRIHFIDGFYKSDGMVFLYQDREDVYLHMRYDYVEEIGDYQDVVEQSMEWYESSKDKFEGWNIPPEPWNLLYRDLQ